MSFTDVGLLTTGSWDILQLKGSWILRETLICCLTTTSVKLSKIDGTDSGTMAIFNTLTIHIGMPVDMMSEGLLGIILNYPLISGFGSTFFTQEERTFLKWLKQ